MRSLILILITLAILGGGLALYTWLQPAGPGQSRKSSSPINRQRATTGQTLRGVGEGENVWVRQFSSKTGELETQFRGRKYTPQQDGTVDVERPEAEFYTDDGRQRVRIEGITGNVVMSLPPEDKAGSLRVQGEPQMPTRGKLTDVFISVFEPVDSATPVLTAKMNNTTFDTDSFRIATEAYVDATGQAVPADQVPVTVRGRDYDFDGRGLVIRWNERDRKLQLLEIAHGESLVIKDPSALGKTDLLPTTRTAIDAPLAEMLASADEADHRLLLAAAKPQSKSKPNPNSLAARRRRAEAATRAATAPSTPSRDLAPVIYRATFDRDVRVFDGSEPSPLATATSMHIDLLQESGKSTTRPSATRRAAHSTTAPATKSARRTAATTQSTDAALKGPIVVKWTGPLRVVPLEKPAELTTPAGPMAPSKAVLRLLGAPAVLSFKGSEARCGELVFNTANSAAALLPSAQVPVVTLLDSNGMKVATPSLHYAQAGPGRWLATLAGPSSAEFPIEQSKAAKPDIIKAAWAKEGRFALAESAGSQAIERLDLAGDVAIDHPQMKMTSQTLAMSFDPKSATTQRAGSTPPASTRPTEMIAAQWKQIVATGGVECRTKAKDEESTIKSDRLTVDPIRHAGSEDGWLISAQGNVQSTDHTGTMKAGRMTAELAPATKPAAPTTIAATAPATAPAASQPFGGEVRLVSLNATDGVTLTSDDDTTATADSLIAETVNDQLRFTLVGKPEAKVVNKTTTLVGERITVDPSRKIAEIVGPGWTTGVNPDNPAQPMKIAWSGGAIVDGNTDLIDVSGDVKVSTTGADNTTSGATANHLQAKLTTRPSTKPASTQIATTRKTPRDASMSFMQDKEIASGTLTGKVHVQSEQHDAAGQRIGGVNLFAETVAFDQRTGRLDVPVPGTMLYEDHRPPEKEKSTDGPTLASGRGNTAFAWQKGLTFEEKNQQAVMSGDVKVIHHPEESTGQPFELDGQTLTATFSPGEKSATRPATRPATTSPADAMKSLQLKNFSAAGNVHARSARLNFDAAEMNYDVKDHTLTARGSATELITVFDAQSGSSQSASELKWNTQTDEISISKFSGKAIR